jgi:hypothetical protein
VLHVPLWVSRDATQGALPSVLECQRAGLDRGRERDLGEAAGRGDLVAAEEDAVAALELPWIAPGGAG